MLCLLFKNVEAKVVIVDTPPEKPHFEVYAHFFRQKFTLTLQQEQLSMKVDFFPFSQPFNCMHKIGIFLHLNALLKARKNIFLLS